MLKGVKSLIVASLFVGASLCSSTLEETNHIIANTKHPDLKQLIICDREWMHIGKNPQECLKAVDMLLNSKKNLNSKSTYRSDVHDMPIEVMETWLPEVYKQTDEEYIDSGVTEAYVNAGVIYGQLKQHEREVQMYQKALEYDPNRASAHLNLGISYYFGQGVNINKINAYKHWKIAAKQGNSQAQKNLDILCRESPWACK
jgi:tetratricopeptide (TPR) repeat protein